MRLVTLIAAVVASSLVAAALWVACDRPVPVEPAWNGPLSSVSFAPFRRGQSPLTKTYPTPKQVEEDLRSLVGRTRGIRTYTAREGMEVVPDLAAKLGLKVIFGAWLGTKKETNDKEINALIKAANEHPNEIERVLVGNEVLLRRDLKPQELIAYIRKVKAAVKQPVSYADVWAFYLKYPEVGREVDYITIHILPFWEDEPVDIDHVESHIVRIVERIRQAFPGKPILIGEAGWPSLGRDRGPAVVSTVDEARFVRQMANIAAKYNFDYNIVEAFDQPWKAALENTVGAAWGILDIDRKPKFAMSGPVTEVADWPLRACVAISLGALATLLFGAAIPGLAGRLVIGLLAQVLAWLTVTTGFHVVAVSFRWWQDIWGIFRGGLAAAFAVVILERAALFVGAPETAVGGPRAALTAFTHRLSAMTAGWQGEALTIFSGFYAVAWTFLLTVDGRYRDIPVIDFAVPTVGIAALVAIRGVQALRQGMPLLPALSLDDLFAQGPGALSGIVRSRLSGWLTWALPAVSVAALISEGWAIVGEDFTKDHPTLAEQIPLVLRATISNREMLLWAAMLLVMAVPFATSVRRRTADAAAPAEAEPAE